MNIEIQAACGSLGEPVQKLVRSSVFGEAENANKSLSLRPKLRFCVFLAKRKRKQIPLTPPQIAVLRVFGEAENANKSLSLRPKLRFCVFSAKPKTQTNPSHSARRRGLHIVRNDFLKGVAHSFRRSSVPNLNRCAGLRFGFAWLKVLPGFYAER